jgi:hypothetical protein
MDWILLTQDSVKMQKSVNIIKLIYNGQFFERHSDDYLVNDDTVSCVTVVLGLLLHNFTYVILA